MPPRTPLSVSSWSNSVHYSRMARPSTPIEIPHRHRPSSTNMSSFNSAYADIFDMSPASPSMADGVHSHRHNHGQDVQFMYHFPTYSSNRNVANGSPRSRPLPHPQQNNSRSYTSPPNAAYVHATARGQPSPQHPPEKRTLLSSQSAATGVASKQSTPVSIVGFTPLKPSPSSPSHPTTTSTRKKSNRVRLSPPPMSFSYSANPWILPGRGDTIEGEGDEFDGEDECADYEFDKHLMNRINGRRTVQRYGKPTFTGANHD